MRTNNYRHLQTKIANRIILILLITLCFAELNLAFAQDISFNSVNRDLTGLGNINATAASPHTSFLNTALNEGKGLQANSLATANTIDVADGDINADGIDDIVSITSDDTNNDGIPDAGNLVLFNGSGNGTFKLPRIFHTTNLPVAVALVDLDMDGLRDIIVAEQGLIEIFSGFYLASGRITFRDRLGNPAVNNGKGLLPANDISSIALGMLDGDSVPELIISEQGSAGNTIEVYYTASNNGSYKTLADYKFNTIGATGASTRSIAVQSTNIPDPVSNSIDGDLDLIIATSAGIEIFENTFPTFTAQPLLAAADPIGVIASDIDGNGKIDIISLNRAGGTVSSFLAAATGYDPPLQINAGKNPIGFSPINFNNDGKVDIALISSATTGTAQENVMVLVSDGFGSFKDAVPINRGLVLANPKSIVIGKLDSGASDDIVIANGANIESPGGVLLLSARLSYNPNQLQIVSTISLATDFDGSGGINDLIMIEQNLGVVFLMLNSFTQTRAINVRDLFTNASLIPTSATVFRDPTSGMNNLAITVTNSLDGRAGTGQIIVGINDSQGMRRFRQFVATAGATNLMSGDFNGDGFDDLVYIDFFSNLVGVALNDGRSLFLDTRLRETGGFIPVSAALVDVNDDDRLDLAVLNQGNGQQGDQSLVTILLGEGNGEFNPTGSPIQVPDFGLSIVGGMSDIEANNTRRLVDFNNDGFPDLAVASTRGAVINGEIVPTVSILLNRPDSPGNFTLQRPIPLVDDTASNGGSVLQLEASKGGPGIVSGILGDPSVRSGVGIGGGNNVVGVGDFNADGSQDLVVTGSKIVDNVNFRSSVYLLGNAPSGNMIVRPQRSAEYGGTDTLAGYDTFVACATGNFSSSLNTPADTAHVSINGKIWLDLNNSPLINQAPIINIRRQDLNAPIGNGRKVMITQGQTVTIPVSGFDPDNDRLTFKLAPTAAGEQPPSFITIASTSNTTGTLTINSGNIIRTASVFTFRICVEATDSVVTGGPGGRLPLTSRAYFTLIVRPNSPPVVGAIPDQKLEAGRSTTVNINVNDSESNALTLSAKCDKGNFITISNRTLTLAPKAVDVGSTSCSVIATDEFNLISSITFIVTVIASPPTISPIGDQIVKTSEVRNINVSASSIGGNAGLRLSITAAPSFVTMSDNGNGTGTIRIAPSLTDTVGGKVTVQVIDSEGLTAATSFNVIVERSVTITGASFAKPNLFIGGFGFGSTGAKVFINGQEISQAILNQTDTAITLRGSKKKLNIKVGPNQVMVIVNGAVSNSFVFQTISAEKG